MNEWSFIIVMPLNYLNPYKSYATKDLTKKNILLMIYQLVTLIRFCLNLTESKYSHPLVFTGDWFQDPLQGYQN